MGEDQDRWDFKDGLKRAAAVLDEEAKPLSSEALKSKSRPFRIGYLQEIAENCDCEHLDDSIAAHRVAVAKRIRELYADEYAADSADMIEEAEANGGVLVRYPKSLD